MLEIYYFYAQVEYVWNLSKNYQSVLILFISSEIGESHEHNLRIIVDKRVWR